MRFMNRHPSVFGSIILFAAVAFIFIASGVTAQSNKQKQEKKVDPPSPAEQKDETIKIDVDLVNVPLVASDRNDVYVYDLQKEDFTLTEDGVKQEIVFFGTVREPFHVVLMLDTSGSTREKLGKIQDAAKAFVNQLQSQDRLKIISFDDNVRDWGDFSNDRAQLRTIIDFLSPGQGTKLYDAVKLGLNTLQSIKGRKAVVLFSDGVDYHSDSTKYGENIRQVEESGVLVYPIRYDTRADTEAMLRDQVMRGESSDLGTIFGGGGSRPSGTTPPTIPGGRSPVPGGGGIPDVLRLPIPPVIVGGGGRYPDRYPDNRNPRDRYPDNRNPRDRYPDNRNPRDRFPDDRRYPDDPTRTPRDRRYPDDPARSPSDPRYPDSTRGRTDSIGVMLDSLYQTADAYLGEMAGKSGGKLYRADTLRSLPDAFAGIAAELRNQYVLGYYPTNQARDGQYRKLQVRVARRDVIIRSRPGYRAPGGNPTDKKNNKDFEKKNFAGNSSR